MPTTLPPRQCNCCGTAFTPRRANQLYCRAACRFKLHNLNRAETVERMRLELEELRRKAATQGA